MQTCRPSPSFTIFAAMVISPHRAQDSDRSSGAFRGPNVLSQQNIRKRLKSKRKLFYCFVGMIEFFKINTYKAGNPELDLINYSVLILN